MKRLLCTDLDRTLIPNGTHPLSPNAKNYLERLLSSEQVTLAYVTGRSRELIEQAIDKYCLPTPNFAIADVGATIYHVDARGWHSWSSWYDHLAKEWAGIDFSKFVENMAQIPGIWPQEPEKQSEFKISFYVSMRAELSLTTAAVESCLQRLGVRSNLIWSIDEIEGVRLLDVLPSRANKLYAIRHLMQQRSFSIANTVFAGDSGNDVDVLASDIQAILVANADAETKAWASRFKSDSLYVAKGGLLGTNGNYCAGILEGIVHYWPDLKRSLDQLTYTEAN